ncbi:uncharacterized protein BKA78DRAFT_360477 [Phyllosticta capitalensis]|uniref:uncharacterized protein n=1 Tax=Phyllosticta capitalensis TaxID=121624 RepID=UPI00313118E0
MPNCLECNGITTSMVSALSCSSCSHGRVCAQQEPELEEPCLMAMSLESHQGIILSVLVNQTLFSTPFSSKILILDINFLPSSHPPHASSQRRNLAIPPRTIPPSKPPRQSVLRQRTADLSRIKQRHGNLSPMTPQPQHGLRLWQRRHRILPRPPQRHLEPLRIDVPVQPVAPPLRRHRFHHRRRRVQLVDCCARVDERHRALSEQLPRAPEVGCAVRVCAEHASCLFQHRSSIVEFGV